MNSATTGDKTRDDDLHSDNFFAAAMLAVLARWGCPSLRAALYASGSAVMWALVATFTKATTDTLAQFGVGGMFTSPSLNVMPSIDVARC